MLSASKGAQASKSHGQNWPREAKRFTTPTGCWLGHSHPKKEHALQMKTAGRRKEALVTEFCLFNTDDFQVVKGDGSKLVLCSGF